MTIQKTSWLINVLAVIAIVVTAVFLFSLSQKIDEVDNAAASRFYTNLLVDELRKSSEELTRQVRNYAATGQASAQDAYNNVLAVRSGQTPRPVNARVAPGQKRVLLDLLREYGITDGEYRLVEQANAGESNEPDGNVAAPEASSQDSDPAAA
jgi:methyl-accepting chemotaxis protein